MTGDSTRCPHCGESTRRPMLVWIALAVAVVALIAVGWLVLRDGAHSEPEATSPIPIPELSSFPVQSPTRSTPEDLVEPAPAETATPPPLPPRALRWANDWANVRADRGVEYEVVLVLRPGDSVEVSDRRLGWWAVYLDDRLIGYVVNNLLDTVPP